MHKSDIGSICNVVASCHKVRKKGVGLLGVAFGEITPFLNYISGHILHHSSAAHF